MFSASCEAVCVCTVWTGPLLAADFLWASEHTLLSAALREPVLMFTALGWLPKATLYIESESRKKISLWSIFVTKHSSLSSWSCSSSFQKVMHHLLESKSNYGLKSSGGKGCCRSLKKEQVSLHRWTTTFKALQNCPDISRGSLCSVK